MKQETDNLIQEALALVTEGKTSAEKAVELYLQAIKRRIAEGITYHPNPLTIIKEDPLAKINCEAFKGEYPSRSVSHSMSAQQMRWFYAHLGQDLSPNDIYEPNQYCQRVISLCPKHFPKNPLNLTASEAAIIYPEMANNREYKTNDGPYRSRSYWITGQDEVVPFGKILILINREQIVPMSQISDKFASL
jgi:hypothetical protein